MVNYASQRGIYTITSTNGHFWMTKEQKETIESRPVA
jgi:predicted ThiF/HesA family dinucleotide-utilizing enzyme